MNYEDLPDRWKTKLTDHLQQCGGGYRGRPGAYDFSVGKRVVLKFCDGSTATFNCAFVLNVPELDEVAVFTEHCGYHIFSMGGTYINILSEEE